MNVTPFLCPRKNYRLMLTICTCLSVLTLSYFSSRFDPLLQTISYTNDRLLSENSVHCELQPPIEPPPAVVPIVTASYPGSGSKMTWNLIEALTGFWTGDDWFTNGREENVVSMKTHYPHPQGRLVPFQEDIERVLLLIRHPMDAIASYHNYIYEIENNFQPHSIRAPVDAWIPWRDVHFESELKFWKETIMFWMDSFSRNNRLVLFYEKLIEDEIGPFETERLSSFLGREPAVKEYDHDGINCVWRAIVKYHEQLEETYNPEDGTEILRKLKKKPKPKTKTKTKRKTKSIEQEMNLENSPELPSTANVTIHTSPVIEVIAEEAEKDVRKETYRPNPASFRSGPREKPFTMQQHVMVWQVLKDLQKMYSGSELYWMFDAYIERVLHS